MYDNFEIQIEKLQEQINELKKEAEDLQKSYPGNAVINARKACEAICKHICYKSGQFKDKNSLNMISLGQMINLIYEEKLCPRYIFDDIKFIQHNGNASAHSKKKIDPEHATRVLNSLTNLVNWYFSGTTSQNEGDEEQGESSKLTTETEQVGFIETIAETYKKPWFKTVAATVMAATATALAAKGLKK